DAIPSSKAGQIPLAGSIRNMNGTDNLTGHCLKKRLKKNEDRPRF
ncbi:MAG: hypothetical protein ACI9NT_000429, partial [Bacteroidia bacterium]